MREVPEDAFVIDASEEAHLRRAFRRFALPYFAGIVALVLGLWLLAERGTPVPAARAAPDVPAVPETIREPAAGVEPSELAALRADLKLLRDALAKVEAEAQRAMRAAERARAAGAAEGGARVVSQTSAAGASPSDDVSRALLERMFNIETRQEKQEAEALRVQKSLLDRVYAIETSREASIRERTTLEQSILGRVKNMEDRFFALERAQSAATPAAASP